MKAELGNNLNIKQEKISSNDLRLKIEKSLKQINTLRHKEIKGAVRGLEGMKIANEILVERRSVGYLFAGVAEEMYKESSSVESLDKHKDVDILSFKRNKNKIYQPEEKFEGGIDWWCLEENENGREFYLRNGTGIALPYNTRNIMEYESTGLHLLKLEKLLEMKYIEYKSIIPDAEKVSFAVFAKIYKEQHQLNDEINPDILNELKQRGFSEDFADLYFYQIAKE